MAVDVTAQGTWPNAEDVVKALCRGVLVDGQPVRRVGRETAPGDRFETPCIRVERTGGQINRDFTADDPLVEVACFGDSYEQAQAMSGSVARLMEASLGERIGSTEQLTGYADIEVVRQENGPQRPAWGPNARRDITTWRLSWRPNF